MKASLIATAVFSLATALPAQARCKHEAMPTVLDAIVVTPSGAYTVAEYEARMEQRQHLEQTKVVLAPVVVTPADPYAESAQTEVAQAQPAHETSRAPLHASATLTPKSPMQQPSVIKFLRRLFF